MLLYISNMDQPHPNPNPNFPFGWRRNAKLKETLMVCALAFIGTNKAGYVYPLSASISATPSPNLVEDPFESDNWLRATEAYQQNGARLQTPIRHGLVDTMPRRSVIFDGPKILKRLTNPEIKQFEQFLMQRGQAVQSYRECTAD